MQFIVFAISYPLIWLLSKLPMRILYLKSDFFYFLIYYVIGYRKKVVLDKIEITKIEDYANRIKDHEVKKYVSDYLLKNHLQSKT